MAIGPRGGIIVGVTVTTDTERQVVPGRAHRSASRLGGDRQVDPRVQQRRRVANAITVTLQVDLQEPHVEVAGSSVHRPPERPARPSRSRRTRRPAGVLSVQGQGGTVPAPLCRGSREGERVEQGGIESPPLGARFPEGAGQVERMALAARPPEAGARRPEQPVV